MFSSILCKASQVCTLGIGLALGGCYPPYTPPSPTLPAVALPAVPVITAPQQSQQAAVAVAQSTKDTELRAKDLATAVYERVVERVRQGDINEVDYRQFQALYDTYNSQLHAFSVLSPLDSKLKERAYLDVAKALHQLLAYANGLNVFGEKPVLRPRKK